jgi:hypothetical protein
MLQIFLRPAKETSHLLRNPNFHYRGQNSPALVRVLSHQIKVKQSVHNVGTKRNNSNNMIMTTIIIIIIIIIINLFSEFRGCSINR